MLKEEYHLALSCCLHGIVFYKNIILANYPWCLLCYCHLCNTILREKSYASVCVVSLHTLCTTSKYPLGYLCPYRCPLTKNHSCMKVLNNTPCSMNHSQCAPCRFQIAKSCEYHITYGRHKTELSLCFLSPFITHCFSSLFKVQMWDTKSESFNVTMCLATQVLLHRTLDDSFLCNLQFHNCSFDFSALTVIPPSKAVSWRGRYFFPPSKHQLTTNPTHLCKWAPWEHPLQIYSYQRVGGCLTTTHFCPVLHLHHFALLTMH